MSLILLLAAFIAGSIPFSWLLVRILKGIDLRTVGSGNPGATNAIRVVGPCWGGLAMALDVGKGLFAGACLPLLVQDPPGWLPALSGCMAILGNVFSPFLKFRGGKAVATAGGVFLGLSPRATLLVAILFFTLLKITRKTSIASLSCALILPLAISVEACLAIGDHPNRWVVMLVWAAAGIVTLRHRENISRLLAGRESTITPTEKVQP